MSLDPPRLRPTPPSSLPSPWPTTGWPDVESLRWAGRLQGCAEEWAVEARLLRAIVATRSLGGPCGRALADCGDGLAAEVAAVAATVASWGAALRTGPTP